MAMPPGYNYPVIFSTRIITYIFLAIYIVSFLYCRNISYRDPTSFFFDPSRAYERHYSTNRIKETDAFLARASEMTTPVRQDDEVPTICLGIVTVRRRGDQYVSWTVASLLEGLGEIERKAIFLDLLIANSDPTDHPIYSEPWIKTLPDRVQTYSENDTDFKKIEEWEANGWYRNKTIYDYTRLMKTCFDTGAAYIAMIEDDVLAKKGWLPVTLQALATVEELSGGLSWVYLRLFFADKLLGWNFEEWPIYLAWSSISWVLVTGVMLTTKKCLKRAFKKVGTGSMWIISYGFIPAIICLFFMAGRQTVWPISPGVHIMNRYGCCSQGLVFPRSIIPQLLGKTDLTTDWLVDMMIEKIADNQGWSRWAVVPALLQHIGATSSKGYGFDTSAKSLWNFQFEDDGH